MEAVACPRCGTLNPPGAKFCAQCATPLPRAADATTVQMPAAPAPQTVVIVPAWLTRDWGVPIALAIAASVIGILINYVVQIFVVIGALISSGSDVAWNDLLLQPIVVWSGFHGAIKGFSVLVTGLIWILVAFTVARRFLTARLHLLRDAPPPDRTAIGTRALKTGFAYMLVVVVVSSVITGLTDDGRASPLFTFGGAGLTSGLGTVNVAGAILAGFTIGAMAALAALTRAATMPLAMLLGLRTPWSLPAWWAAALAGARRTLVIGIVGMALFSYGALLILVSDRGGSAQSIASFAFASISWVLLWSVIDVGGIFFVNGMRFFIDEPAPVLFGKPGWIYTSVLIVAAAFFLGGLRAARLRQPSDGVGAARAAASILVLVIPCLFVGSLFWQSESGDDIIASALLLPVLWGAVAVLGGLYHANQAGLPPGVVVQTSPSPSPSPPEPIVAPSSVPAAKPVAKRTTPTACPNCSEPVAPNATFCSACGTRLKKA